MLDGREIGEGTRGPITTKLQTMYFDQVTGNSPYNQDWLTLVK